jgi:hypothetical protein
VRFLLGFTLGVSLIACAAKPVFPYKFYHLTGNNFAGMLLGPVDKDDIPFSRCAPVNGKQQCVVVTYSELTALINDYKTTKQKLIDCERGR